MGKKADSTAENQHEATTPDNDRGLALCIALGVVIFVTIVTYPYWGAELIIVGGW